MDFGFTNDKSQWDAAIAFRDAAIADGWTAEPYFPNESFDQASRLSRDGFICSILTRDKRETVGTKWKFQAKVNIWAPDGLAIAVPMVYDSAVILSSQRRCQYCKAEDVDTQRVGFAGRCCANCLPEKRKQIERPGWCE